MSTRYLLQMICDAQHYVTDIVARWPGSVHDARIFRESAIAYRLEQGMQDWKLTIHSEDPTTYKFPYLTYEGYYQCQI